MLTRADKREATFPMCGVDTSRALGRTALGAALSVTRLATRLTRLFSVFWSEKSGTDARFSYESRQVAVNDICLTSNGVQGVAGSIPPSP
jgi:hypothetical protein